MLADRQGNRLTGATAEALDGYENAVTSFNLYRGDPVGDVDRAIAAAPGFAMAHVLKAWLFALATEPAAAAEAVNIANLAGTLKPDEREASHLAAIGHVLAGNWTDAANALDSHSMDWPHDIVALQAGHLIDFFRANARQLRDRIGRTLPRWADDMPGYSALLGMYAFGLEEAGDYARAEATGREALDRQPLDGWAHHAVAHVLEMQGRTGDGLDWMVTREPHWADDGSYLKVHNWWHKALYHLELQQGADALALYDERVRGHGGDLAVNLLDASALLWRIHMEGRDVADRWSDLADAWMAHADGKLYPFNDFHAAMAFLGAGRSGEIERLLKTYRETEPTNEAQRWGRDIALPLIEGFTAFWSGNHAAAVDKLHGARYIANAFGGSHAQRDVIDWTLTEAAIRGGMHGAAEALANERLALKPHSPLNRAFLKRAGSFSVS
jgi:tetratricopeptide (TPR) repeat protein